MPEVWKNKPYILIVFFDWKGIVHHEFVPHDHIAIKKFEKCVSVQDAQGMKNKP